MNILVISPFLPYPLNSGGNQGVFNILNVVRQKHNVYFMFPIDKDNTSKNVQALSKIWNNVEFIPYTTIEQCTDIEFLGHKLKRAIDKYFHLSTDKRKISDVLGNLMVPCTSGLKTKIAALLDRVSIDLVEVNFFPAIKIVDAIPTTIPKVFVHHELRFVISERYLSNMILSQTEKDRMLRRKEDEIWYLNKYDAVFTLTNVDKQILIDNGVRTPMFVSPLAVNTGNLSFKGWNGKLLYIGGYGHTPNHEGIDWFLSKVTPLINWSSYSGIELKIVGKGWPNNYNNNFNGLSVQTLGFVKDLSSVASNSILIVPLLTGSGMRMKILDAAAMSLPIITTSVGCEGLCFKNNFDCVIGDTPKSFSNALLKVMDDVNFRNSIAKKGNETFQNNYSVKKLSSLRLNLYNNIIKKK